jgi:hypothetical protein
MTKVFTRDDFLITTQKEWTSKDSKVKAALKNKILDINKRRHSRNLIRVHIQEFSRGKHRFMVSADCCNGQFFSAKSFERLHKWMVENIGIDYQRRLDGSVLSPDGGHCGDFVHHCGDFVYHRFETFAQSLEFAIEVCEAAKNMLIDI